MRLLSMMITLAMSTLIAVNVNHLSAQDAESGAPAVQQNGSKDPAAAYAAKMAEWKDLLKALRKLKADYQTADAAQIEQIKTEWEQLIDEGEKLIPELRVLGAAAFTAAPNSDRALTQFLVKLAEDEIARDRYESAAELCETLIDGGCEEKEIYNSAATAAFATADFENAKKYFEIAKEAGVLAEPATRYEANVDDYIKYWEEERKIREAEAEADDLPRVKLTTTKGDIVIELFENEAPGAVGNFVSLVEKGFYDNLTFHRVLSGFMAQGGCPTGDGTGGPGYNIECECYQDNYRKHFRGSLSMAHAGRDTGGSQFFLTFLPTAHLNGRHTVFGRVIEGMDVATNLQRIDPNDFSSAVKPDRIVKAEVLRKRDHEYVPNKVK